MNALCAALVETEVAGDKHKAKMKLETLQLQQDSNFKAKIGSGARGVVTVSMVIFDTVNGPNLIRDAFIVTAWTPSKRTVKIGRLWSASSSPFEVEEIIILLLQIEQPRKNVELLVIPGLATSMLLGTAFIGRYIVRCLPKAKTVSPVNSRPAAIAKAAKRSPTRAIYIDKQGEPVEVPCVITRLIRSLTMRGTFLRMMS